MKKSSLCLVFGIVFLLLTVSSLADFDTQVHCADTGDPPDYDCAGYFSEMEGIYYCNKLIGNCFLNETVAEPSLVSDQVEPEKVNEVEALTIEQKVAALEEDLKNLQNTLATATSGISLSNTEIASLKTELASLKSNFASLKNDFQQGIDSVGSQTNSLATGLSSLQTEIEETQTTLDAVQETLNQRKTITWVLIISAVVFLVAGGVIYYITRKKTGALDPEIVNYITKHIKQGEKYAKLKKELLKAGWGEEEIKWAYQETAKHNYEKFKANAPRPFLAEGEKKAEEVKAADFTITESTEPTEKIKPGITQDSKKIISIAVVSVLLIIGVIFLLQGTIGKAIFFQGSFEQTKPFICTPPHIVTEGGCCLDVNNNTICDTTEGYDAEKAGVSAEVCDDHRECVANEFCIDSKCMIYDETSLYNVTNCPGTSCNIKAIQILTSDGESYKVHGRQGSYAAAGALAWIVRPIPNYCGGKNIAVPIEIVKKDLVCYDQQEKVVSCGQKDLVVKTRSEIVSKEIITLKAGQTSKKLIHPNPLIEKKLNGYTLTLQYFNEFCFG